MKKFILDLTVTENIRLNANYVLLKLTSQSLSLIHIFRANFDNPKGILKSGLYVSITLPYGEAKNAVLVKEMCIRDSPRTVFSNKQLRNKHLLIAKYSVLLYVR